MKKVLSSTIALLAFAGGAGAADLPVKAPRMAAPVPVAYDWNGFYVGGYFGDALGHAGATNTFGGVSRWNDKGLTAGLTAGWNWQVAPQWLLGVEGDIGWLDLNRTQLDWNDRVSVGVKTDWYATARGRFGYVTGPSLIYATGGAAFVHLRDTFGGDVAAGFGPTTNTVTKTGFTVGGGIETKLSRAWTAKTEYLFIDVGDNTFASNPYAAVAGTPTTMSHSFHVIKTGLNYKFGEPFLEGLPLFGTSVNIPSDHVWGGFYAGVNVGGGISNIRASGGSTTVTGGTEQDINSTGFAGGGHVGYNLMNVANFLGSAWFVGVEGDIGALDLNSSEADWFDSTHIFADKTHWYATARGRVGTSTGPALLYMTGGAAWVNLTDTLTIAGLSSGTSRTAGGWTFGGGMEVALDTRWSARIESLYMDVGHRTLAVGSSVADFKDRFTVVRAGLSYSFGGP